MADTFMRAVMRLRPGVNFSNGDDTLSGIRWDEPLPQGFVPPTRAQVDAEIARLEVGPTPEQKLAAAGLTVDDLKQLLGLT